MRLSYEALMEMRSLCRKAAADLMRAGDIYAAASWKQDGDHYEERAKTLGIGEAVEALR